MEKSKQVFFYFLRLHEQNFHFSTHYVEKEEEEENLSGKLVKNKLTSRKGDERWKEDDEK